MTLAPFDYANPSDALGRLDPDERSVATLALSEGSRVVTRERPIINESGVYALVFASSLPDARAFRRWVTSEVLPTIRRTGTYAPAPVFQLPQTYSEALRALAREVELTGLSRDELQRHARNGTVRSLRRATPRSPFRFLPSHLVEDLAGLSRRGKLR